MNAYSTFNEQLYKLTYVRSHIGGGSSSQHVVNGAWLSHLGVVGSKSAHRVKDRSLQMYFACVYLCIIVNVCEEREKEREMEREKLVNKIRYGFSSICRC